MNEIFANLNSPEWWFTGLFFIAMSFFVKWLYSYVPSKLKKLSRSIRAKNLKEIHCLRRSQSAINYEISKANGRYLLFCIVCILYILTLTFYTPMSELWEKNWIAGFIVSLPVYIMEMAWLIKDGQVKQLIKYQNRLNIKKKG
ncbi:TPA: hypothetical protein ACX6S8_000057 [Photobacterium damselae]|uniref:Uncharacterized protein n=1 Tax=Photobacterium damselae subsp. damselae TaxID=85581 RepID=A0A850QUU4_PHODD|nr:hypothetical protein [Photobacterium damselae]NVP03507.1 hypothetical protein [Photobacterium damselae subsp. damselae]